MTRRAWPEIGYNHNVRYRGVAYHVQTEDSGVEHPHVISHLFRDGGHVVKTLRSNYATAVGRADRAKYVRELMKRQHKALLKALLGGHLDTELSDGGGLDTQPQICVSPGVGSEAPSLELDSVLAPYAGPGATQSAAHERSLPTWTPPGAGRTGSELPPASAPSAPEPHQGAASAGKQTPPFGTRVGHYGPSATVAANPMPEAGSRASLAPALRDTTPSPAQAAPSASLQTAATLRSPGQEPTAPSTATPPTPTPRPTGAGPGPVRAPAPTGRRRPVAPRFARAGQERSRGHLSASIGRYLERNDEGDD